MPRKASFLLPILGAAGFIISSELSLWRPKEFLWWSLATMAWILAMFALLAWGKLRGSALGVAIPTLAMIAITTVMSLLFLDLLSPRRGVIFFFGLVLYLFLEHVRHETTAPNDEERLTIAEFARMVNISSMFLVASVAIGLTIFLPVPSWTVLIALAPIAALWSWHLYAACTADCAKPLPRILLTTAILIESYLVALRLPTSMFVGGALISIIYYLAANLVRIGSASPVSPKLVRRYSTIGIVLTITLLAAARWSS